MVTATRGKVLTLPTAGRPKWSPPPRPVPPPSLGDCPECGRIVWGLNGSPRRRPHLVSATPCGCWLLPDEADELENGAWQ